MSQTVVEMANTFNLSVNEDDIQELLGVASEELTNEECGTQDTELKQRQEKTAGDK